MAFALFARRLFFVPLPNGNFAIYQPRQSYKVLVEALVG
jgi:hypothetical protein